MDTAVRRVRASREKMAPQDGITTGTSTGSVTGAQPPRRSVGPERMDTRLTAIA